jgi:hypothetical protein
MPIQSHAPASPEPIQFSLRGLLVVVSLIALCAGAVGLLNRREARRKAELAKLAELDKTTVVVIVKDVEAVRAELGRAPKDEDELETLLGRKMPVVHDNGHPTPINYRRTGNNSFMLQYELWATDDWIYDSTIPQAGWVQHYY